MTEPTLASPYLCIDYDGAYPCDVLTLRRGRGRGRGRRRRRRRRRRPSPRRRPRRRRHLPKLGLK
jgi:hypothetical protein